MSGRQVQREQVAVKVGERFLLVQADDIIYASLADESINIVTGQVTGSSNYRTLDDLQARLDPEVFWRVHRSHLVNINKIKEIVPWFSRNYILRMKDAKGTEIPVSRSADQAAPGIPEAVTTSAAGEPAFGRPAAGRRADALPRRAIEGAGCAAIPMMTPVAADDRSARDDAADQRLARRARSPGSRRCSRRRSTRRSSSRSGSRWRASKVRAWRRRSRIRTG